MKNRIAAQSARDRKKAKMELLSDKVAKLTKETINLSKQMKILQQTNAALIEENKLLKAQLNSQDGQTVLPPRETGLMTEIEVPSPPVTTYCPVESAELINVSLKKTQGQSRMQQMGLPQLKSKSHTSTILMMQFVCLLMSLMSQTNCSTGSSNVRKNSSNQMRQAAICRIAREMDQPMKLKKLAQKVIHILQVRKRLKGS